MICPHCQTTIDVPHAAISLNCINGDGQHIVAVFQCPACHGVVVDLLMGKQVAKLGFVRNLDEVMNNLNKVVRIYPRNSNRPAPPHEVPKEYAVDYNEAALTLADSPKASAALSRRCLQHILQNELKIVKPNLFLEIDEAIKGHGLPSHVAEGLDAVRNIGNFAAHPKKSTASGEIIDVEPGEAEWSLDVLDGLFDHLFVGPARMRARMAALEAKLRAAKGP
jgi:hypothetical protein